MVNRTNEPERCIGISEKCVLCMEKSLAIVILHTEKVRVLW